MSDEYIYLPVQELANRTIRIENTGLKPTFMTMPTDKETGKVIGNIVRIQIDIEAKPDKPHITAKVTLADFDRLKRLEEEAFEEVTIENPELLIDAEVAEIEMRWKADL